MITKEYMGTAEVSQYITGHPIGYQAQIQPYSVPGDGRTPGGSAYPLGCHSACLSQAQNRPSLAPCYGRTPGVPAHACDCLGTWQGQDEHDLLCLVKLPGSFHLQPFCSHIGTSGGYGHNNPLSESPGGLSETPPPPALPVCHLGLPGSAGMADSRMASPAAAPGRLTICSVGMRHVEKNHRLGTQILPGSISGFYHREQYQAARHVLERCFRARFIEIVDLRPLKDARSYPDLRDHMGWHPTNCLINMHDRSLRDIAARIVEALRELANRARGERGTPGDCLLLLGCNQGRHRSPMIRYLLTRWMEESHGMTVDSSDVDNVHWRRHGECTLARQCVHCDVRNHDATREACVAWFKHEMDIAIQHLCSATWASANEISWLGLRDLGIERLPPGPPLPDLPAGLFHAERDYSPPPPDPRSRSRGLSGGVSLGRGDSRPPPGGRSVTPGPRHRQQGKGASQGSPPHLTHVSRWTRAQQAQGKGKGAARPVTLQPAPSQGPPAVHVAPDVRHTGAAVDVIEVDPAPGVLDRAASVIDVDALPATVDAGVSEASITHCLNLLRTALLNNEITEEQSSHLSRLSLSTRSQTVGLWDVGTQTADYGPVQMGTARQSPANPYTNPVSASANVSGRNKMPASVPTARQSGAAASTQTTDVLREVPVEPTARRQGSRPPSYAAAAAAATAAPQAAAARSPPRIGRSPPPPGGRGVRIPDAAVEVFNMAADDSDHAAPPAGGPDARRRGPSRSRRGQSVSMSERIADSREDAGLPRYSEAAEHHYARRESGAPAEEAPPRDPNAIVERTIAAPGAGRGRQTLAMVNEVPPLPQRIREWPRPRGGGLSWSTARPHQILAYLYGRTDMTGVDVIGAVRHDAEQHSRNFGYDGVQNEGLTPGVKVDIKRFPQNSAVGVPTAARFGCKTGFALYQIDEHTWRWQLIENRDPAETTTHLMQNGVCPALYISVIQPYCQAEYGGISAESRAASDRLDRPFTAPLSPSLMASMQVPRRQAGAAAQPAEPHRQATAATARGTVATSMASASASVVPPLIPLQRRRIRGLSGVSSTESASPTDFPGPTVFDTDVDRQADSTVKQEEADLQEDLALADSLNTALPGRHEDDEEVAATQQDGEEDAVDEGEEEEEMEEEEEEVATRQAQVAPPPQEGGLYSRAR